LSNARGERWQGLEREVGIIAVGGVGAPYSLAVLKKDGKDWRARKLDEIELQEQSEHINEVEKLIGGYLDRALEEAAASTPPMPPDEPPTNAGTRS
jgi:hypothetical protein